MYATGTKKMLNMLILEILQVYSDELHPLTQQEIIWLLKKDYGMDCDRRSVRNNILCLKELGYDISTENGYFLAQRQFEDSELRLLIDSVLCSKNLTNTQAKRLIEKLQACGNKYFQPKVKHIHLLSALHYSDNKQLMYVIDALNDVIEGKKQVAFFYNVYGTDKKLHPKRRTKDVVNPYQIVTANGFYYLIGNINKFNDIVNFRLDKISDIEILDSAVREIEERFDFPKHMAEHLYMYSGESVSAKLLAPVNMMNELIDWFGKDLQILEQRHEDLLIRIVCNEQALFYWALQYGAYVEVIEPVVLRNKISDTIADMMLKYSRKDWLK